MKHLFFYDSNGFLPVGCGGRLCIAFNLSTMPDEVEAWIDLITHECLEYLILTLYSDVDREEIVETVLELAGLTWTGWGM